MTTSVFSPRTVSRDRVGVYLPSQSWRTAPAFELSRAKALQLQADGQAEFVNKGRAIQLKSFNVLSARSKQLGSCKTCGAGSFHTICFRCRRDEIVFRGK
jgi:hypothetical protein